MKKLIVVAVLMLLSSVCLGEVYYRISKKDYNEIVLKKCSLKTDVETMEFTTIVKVAKLFTIEGIGMFLDKLEKYDTDVESFLDDSTTNNIKIYRCYDVNNKLKGYSIEIPKEKLK